MSRIQMLTSEQECGFFIGFASLGMRALDLCRTQLPQINRALEVYPELW